MIVKMTILRLLGSSDDNEKIGVARPEGPPLWGFRPSRVSGQRPETSSVQRTKIEETSKKPSQRNQDRDTLVSPVESTLRKSHTSVH
jgi:hypothetical protein